MSETVTRGIRILVQPRYVPEQSEPTAQQYLFAYHITIRNEGEEPAQLLSRHWVITDGEGKTDEVRGPGVVGHQPLLKPGEAFEYTSGCPLTTPVGSMHGSYTMELPERGERFEARIAPFTLAVPRALN
ncbi:MAG TPA: Co2+/Mg2+ efflux protein ApaG [Solimonas sp.]